MRGEILVTRLDLFAGLFERQRVGSLALEEEIHEGINFGSIGSNSR